MSRNFIWLSLGGFLASALLFVVDLPASDFTNRLDDNLNDDLFQSCMETVKRDCQSWALTGGGSEAPRGLSSNTKAELAIGDRYVLTGTISVARGTPYLHISFADHPWLASRVRLGNPYYRLRDDGARWRRYNGKIVTIVVTVRYSAWAQDDGRMVLEILLEPETDSIIDAIQPESRRR